MYEDAWGTMAAAAGVAVAVAGVVLWAYVSGERERKESAIAIRKEICAIVSMCLIVRFGMIVFFALLFFSVLSASVHTKREHAMMSQ